VPKDDFIISDSKTNLTLNPMLYSLNGMIMLSHSSCAYTTYPGIKLNDEEKQEIDLIFNGLYHSLIPEKAFPDFPSYLKNLSTCNPEQLQTSILKFYIEKHNWSNGLYKGKTFSEIREIVLDSSENYLKFLSEGFDPAHYSVEIEKEAYKLLINPEIMQKRITRLLSSLWEKYFKLRWEEVREDLEDFVARTDINYLYQLSREKTISHMTGIEISEEKLSFVLNTNPPILFIPSYDLKNSYSKIVSAGILYIFFDPVHYENRRLNAQLSDIDELSRKLAAIADSSRLGILKYIIKKQEACSQDILRDLGFSQSAVSRHLQQLSTSGLLSERRQMSAKYYRVKAEYIKSILESVSGFLGI